MMLTSQNSAFLFPKRF